MLPVTGDVACYMSCYQLQVMLPVTCHVTSYRLCCLLHVMLLVHGLVACYRSCCQLMCDETPCHVKIQTMHEFFILGGGVEVEFLEALTFFGVYVIKFFRGSEILQKDLDLLRGVWDLFNG